MSIHEEVRAAPTLEDILDGRSMYLNVALHYVRPKQTVFVRETLATVIKNIVNEEDLDLETDPVVVRVPSVFGYTFLMSMSSF